MKFSFRFQGLDYSFSLNEAISIALPLKNGEDNINAWGLDNPEFKPYRAGDFIGSTQLGGSVNCFTLTVSPHGNGTHTECVGHISKEIYTINKCLEEYILPCNLISVYPKQLKNGDWVIGSESLDILDELPYCPGLIIRSLPNDDSKLLNNYSGKNPIYFSKESMERIVGVGVRHLITDLPSVDKEHDGGVLEAHHIYWNYPAETRVNATITELAYIPNGIKDGLYLLNLLIMPVESDASPSKPILYPLYLS